MARLNTRTSTSTAGRPALSDLSGRANTPTMASEVGRGVTPGFGSDKENPRERVDKGKGRMRDSAQPPTPVSADSDERPGSRKRARISSDANTLDGASDEDDMEDQEPSTPSGTNDSDGLVNVIDEQREALSASARKRVRFYDPNQDPSERRAIKRKARDLERELNENRDAYLRPDSDGLARTIERADAIYREMKQTSDATLDSRLMVSVSDLTHRKSTRMAMADGATGIDVDDFVSRCISYMRRANASGTSASQRRRARDDDDDEDDAAEEALDWSYLGIRACHPHNSRPATTAFLLGPLSVQKRVRAATQRRARQRDDGRAETRPEALQREDLETNEINTVRHICGKIKQRLINHCSEGEERVQDEAGDNTLTEEEIDAVFRKHRMTRAGGPSLFDFVVNPKSFGQTVENLFYVSFLIKEGDVGVSMDEDGLPSLVVNSQDEQEAAERRDRSKHQAVFSIDYATWEQLKEAFEIRQGLIPHREESERRVGNRGWYS